MSDLKEKFEEEFQKQKEAIQKPNLLIVGGTGVGKSSLVNRIFGSSVAKTGEGQPITKGIDRYELETIPLVFFDAEGYEISPTGLSRNNFDNYVIPEIERMNQKDLKDQIHLVWYCLSIANHRVTDYDLQNISYFINHNMKLAIVFTQCDLDQEGADGRGLDAMKFQEIISKEHPEIAFFETCASDVDLKLDLEKLINWSSENLPTEQLRRSFIEAQKISIEAKKKMAYKIVMATTGTSSLTAGLNPIPISDSLLIAPQQLAMCIAINKIFWFGTDLSENILDLIKSQIISLFGKQIAASLTKFIPIFGQLINGAVAGGITFALGASIIEVNARAYQKFLETGETPDWLEILSSTTFIESLKSALKNR